MTADAPRRADGRRPFVWLASYMKSGNTWTRLLLANFVADSEQAVRINDLREALPSIYSYDRDWFDRAAGLSSSDFTDDEVEPLRPAALRARAAEAAGRRFCKVHDALHDTAAGEPLLPEDVSAGAVYLVRNPLDVAVSWAFHAGEEDCSEAVTRMNDRRCVLGGGRSHHLRQRLLDWSGHVESWRAAPFPVLVVRYEDLLADTAGQLARMTRFLGLEGAADGRRLRRAAAAADFTRLQEQEARDGFHYRDPRCRRFFRSGRSGDWRRHLSAAQALRVTRRHGAVMRTCGYDPREAEC